MLSEGQPVDVLDYSRYFQRRSSCGADHREAGALLPRGPASPRMWEPSLMPPAPPNAADELSDFGAMQRDRRGDSNMSAPPSDKADQCPRRAISVKFALLHPTHSQWSLRHHTLPRRHLTSNKLPSVSCVISRLPWRVRSARNVSSKSLFKNVLCSKTCPRRENAISWVTFDDQQRRRHYRDASPPLRANPQVGARSFRPATASLKRC